MGEALKLWWRLIIEATLDSNNMAAVQLVMLTSKCLSGVLSEDSMFTWPFGRLPVVNAIDFCLDIKLASS